MPPGTEHDGISSRKVTGSRPLPRETRKARERQMRAVVDALQAPVQLQAVAKTVDEQKLDYYSAIGAKASAVRERSKLSRDLENELMIVDGARNQRVRRRCGGCLSEVGAKEGSLESAVGRFGI